jgi:DNA-binding transcriptional ArsR family regulator
MTREAKMIEAQIAKSRLDRYSDFVKIHSDNGIYNPEKGVEGLLSTLTPDLKCIVLPAMESGDIYFSFDQLHKAVLNWLEGFGLYEEVFPLNRHSSWHYCERRDKKGNIVDGSLVNIGGVVKEIYEETPEGLKIGYCISTAGELAVPLNFAAIEFVWRAENSIPHIYDSMWRIFGGVNSKTEKRRLLPVYKIVRFLIENPGYHRCEDIKEAFRGDISESVISSVLNSLGYAKIIDYKSPDRDIGGRKASGWVTYSLAVKTLNRDEIYKELRKKKHDFYDKGELSKAIEFIEANPKQVYRSDELDNQIIFPYLADIGVLKRKSRFIGRKIQSRERGNDLTRMLYDIVLEPAWQTASNLFPTERRSLNSEKLKTFIENYQAERSNIPEGGEKVRNSLLSILPDSGEMKLSHIVEVGNKLLRGRVLTKKSFEYNLNILIGQELVKKTREGYYCLCH